MARRPSGWALGLLLAAFSSGAFADAIDKAIGDVSRVQVLPVSEAARARAILASGLEAYKKLPGYTAEFRKREKDDGSWKEPEFIFMRFEKPFKVYLRWVGKKHTGRELVYVQGRHNDHMLVLGGGLLSQFGPVFRVGTRDAISQKESTHPIQRIGVGFFLEWFSEDFVNSLAQRVSHVRVAEEQAEGEPAWKIELILDGAKPDSDFYASRVDAWFSKSTKLPIRFHLYNWKHQQIGEYAYAHIKVDGADGRARDPRFRKLASKRLLVYFDARQGS